MPEWLTIFLKVEAFKIEVVALQVSVVLIVLSIGMSANVNEALYLFRRPALLARSIAARNILIPIAAILLVKLFPFPPPVEITIGVLAATPIPPLMPKSLIKAGGRGPYVFGLLVSQAVLAIVIVPLIIRGMDAVFGLGSEFHAAAVAKLVLITILAPLAVGIAISAIFGGASRRAGRIIATIGSVLLICAAIPLVPFAWSTFAALAGQGVLAGLTAMVLIGIVAGHLLGGPDERDRTTLALATASAHPGVAIAIASANFPQQTKLVAGSVVIYLFLRAILVIPYIRWRRRPAIHGENLHTPVRA